MEGGRNELVDVESISHEAPPEAKEIQIFRDVLNDYKVAILDSLTPKDIDASPHEIQTMKLVDEAVARIQELSNILVKILSKSQDLHGKSIRGIDKILKVFHERHLDLNNMDDETVQLCLHYVNHDLNNSTFDTKYKKHSLD